MSWNLFEGCVVGPSHAANATPCQDAFATKIVNNTFLIAVADGAGSLKRSGEGALIAVEEALMKIEESLSESELSEEILVGGIEEAREKILALEDYKAFGSTLVVVALRDSDWFVAALGDSFAVIETVDELKTFTGVSVGEYDNTTALLTSNNVEIVSASGNDAKSVAVSSDGLDHVALLRGEAHPGFWNPMFGRARKGSLDLDDFFAWLGGQDRLVDDTTAVIGVRVVAE